MKNYRIDNKTTKTSELINKIIKHIDKKQVPSNEELKEAIILIKENTINLWNYIESLCEDIERLNESIRLLKIAVKRLKD